MVLDDNVLVVPAEVRLLNFAVQVIVGHREIEVQAVVHIVHAGLRLAFAVEFAAEQTIREHVCRHVLGIAADGDCGECSLVDEINSFSKSKTRSERTGFLPL